MKKLSINDTSVWKHITSKELKTMMDVARNEFQKCTQEFLFTKDGPLVLKPMCGTTKLFILHGRHKRLQIK